MARLGAIFRKNYNFFTNGNLYMNRIQCEFSPFVSTIKSEIFKKIKDLEVPEKPKRPGNPYNMFVKDTVEKLKKEEPLLSALERFKKCAEMWKALDAEQRAKYHQMFKDQQEQYEKVITHYMGQLSEEQKLALDSYKLAKKEDRDDRRRRKELQELGKPRKPQNGYVLFVKEMSMKSSGPFHLKDTAEQWRNMSNTEKNVYIEKAKILNENYKRQLSLWEDKMRVAGRTDLLRRNTLDNVSKRQSRILKFGLPEDKNV